MSEAVDGDVLKHQQTYSRQMDYDDIWQNKDDFYNMSSTSQIDCGSNCLKDDKCTSFFFNPREKTCLVVALANAISGSPADSPSKYENYPGKYWEYYTKSGTLFVSLYSHKSPD